MINKISLFTLGLFFLIILSSSTVLGCYHCSPYFSTRTSYSYDSFYSPRYSYQSSSYFSSSRGFGVSFVASRSPMIVHRPAFYHAPVYHPRHYYVSPVYSTPRYYGGFSNPTYYGRFYW